MDRFTTDIPATTAITADWVIAAFNRNYPSARRLVTSWARTDTQQVFPRRLRPLHRDMGTRARSRSHEVRAIPVRAPAAVLADMAMAVGAHVELTRANAGVTPLPRQGRVLLRR